MANQPDIDCPSELYLEADSKLSAMATFLDELGGDARARRLMVSMVRQLRAIVETGLESVDDRQLDDRPLRRDLERLQAAVEALPQDQTAPPRDWQQLRQSHRKCRESFSQLMDAILEEPRHNRPGMPIGIDRQFDATA